METGKDANDNTATGSGDRQSDEFRTKLGELEEELSDVAEQRKVALARPMRGAEKDALRRQFDRQEARLRESIEAVEASLNED